MEQFSNGTVVASKSKGSRGNLWVQTVLILGKEQVKPLALPREPHQTAKNETLDNT